MKKKIKKNKVWKSRKTNIKHNKSSRMFAQEDMHEKYISQSGK